MALKRQQKVLLCVVGLGAAALTVDRVFIGYDATGPSRAAADGGAAVVDAATSADAASGGMTGVAATPVTSRNIIAERLAQLGAEQSFDIDNLVDAFEPPSDWFAPPRPVEEVKPVAAVEAERAFADRYRLDAVVAGKDNSFAVVNGRAVRPGEALDAAEPGIVLLRVGERSAWFSVHGEQVELQLRTPGSSGNRLR